MPKTAKNSQKRQRLTATKARRKKAHSRQPAATIPDQTPKQAKEQLAKELKRTAPYVASGLRARPADFPIGSMQSRAAARAMSLNRIETDPIRAILGRLARDPLTPEVVVPNTPACGPDCGCDACRLKIMDNWTPSSPVAAKPGSVNSGPEAYTPDLEKLRQALADVNRGFRGSQPGGNAPAPAWANK